MQAIRMIVFMQKGEKLTIVIVVCITKEIGFLNKLVASAGVSWNGTTDVLGDLQKLFTGVFAARMPPHLSSQ